MNISDIKKEFPIFDEKIQNNDLVYLDSANSSQKPKIVLDRINEFYSKQFSNVGRSVHYLAVAATNLYENTRTSVQKYINAKDKNEIVFTKGATEALNLVANTSRGKWGGGLVLGYLTSGPIGANSNTRFFLYIYIFIQTKCH